MRMGIGLGVGINRSNYAQGIFNAYSARVVADGGVVESGSCVDAVSSLLQQASLLLIPSGYKANKLYSEIPTNGNGDLTWTRGGDAFRTNASGVIQRVPWNLVQQSESFNNATWTKFATTITADATLSPNGTLSADNAVPNTSNTDHSLTQSVVQAISGNTYTISIYAKPNGYNFIRLSFGNVAGGGYTFFDVSNGTIGGTSSMLSNSITPVGNGWYRCTVSRTATTSGTLAIDIYIVSANNQFSWVGNGTDGVYIWGSQLVEGTTAQTYLPTTDRLNFPRLSYMYGSCPAVLLEPQRTNLVVNSGMTGGGATPTGYVSFITGSTTAVTSIKNNSVTAYRFSGTSQRAFFVQSIGTTIGTTYSFSVYCESVTTAQAIQDTISGGVIVSYYKNGVAIAGTTNIEAGNFYSIVLTASVISTDIRFGIGVASNITANIVLSMPQFEQGAYATTFILTPTSATATRVADSFSRNNIYTNGLISASGGTWFVELKGNLSLSRESNFNGLFLGDTTSENFGNQFMIRGTVAVGTASRFAILKYVSNISTQLYQTITDNVKIAIKWNGTTADVFVNGVKQVSATTFTATNMENLRCNNPNLPFFIQAMALYNTPLSDTDCATITTL